MRHAIGFHCTRMLDTEAGEAIRDDNMALRTKVSLCLERLKKYEPNVACNVLDPVHLVRDIRRNFDRHHPVQSRASPLTSHHHASDTLCQAHGDIWNGVDCDVVADTSLRACCEHVLVAAMGLQHQAYCREQSYCAILAVRHALLGAHLATPSKQCVCPPTQETIVWHILREHLAAMQQDIRLRWQVP